MLTREKLENTVWWLLLDVAPTLVLLCVVAFLAYTQGQIEAFILVDEMEVCQ
ncbi:hypothetical protein LG325_03240 [Marinobacter nauticus]